MYKFIFDLDGTVTKEETLPVLAKYFDIQDQINELTKDTIRGNIPFMESFIQRVHILGKYSVNQAANILEKVVLNHKIVNFIQENSESCIIATGNLDCWINKLCAKIFCKTHCSIATVENDKVKKLIHILKKENLVMDLQKQGFKVVFIGDGNNDAEAMRVADISIASGLVHSPANSVLAVSDYLVYDDLSLCRLLNQIKAINEN